MPIFTHNERTLLIVQVPKTGGTSLNAALTAHATCQLQSGSIPAGLLCPPQHLPLASLAAMLDLAAFDARLAVVRHPVDRLVSAYRMRVSGAARPLPFEDWANWALDRLRSNPWHLDNHLRPQSEFVDETVEVFRFEDGLAAPLARAAAVLGITEIPPIDHLRRGSKRETLASQTLIDRIAHTYAADFTRFGYEPGAGRLVLDRTPALVRRLGSTQRRLARDLRWASKAFTGR